LLILLIFWRLALGDFCVMINKMKVKIQMLTLLVLVIFQTKAQWTEPSPVAWNSQNVYALATSGNHLFAGTGSSGVSLSTNKANSWSAINIGLASTGISSFVINGSTVIAAGYGAFYSNDNGGSWVSASKGLIDSTINDLAIIGNVVFAGTDKGVFASTTNGAQWTVANTGYTNQVSSLAVKGTTLFAGSYNGVYISTNNGGVWTKIDNGLTNKEVSALAVLGDQIFAGTSGGVFVSSNDGALWTPINNGLNNLNIFALYVNGSNLFAGTDNGVFYSANMGANWNSFNIGFSDTVTVQAFTSDDEYLYAGMRLEPYGVWRRPLADLPKTGFSEGRSVSSFALYPNPANEQVTLDIQSKSTLEVTIHMYSLNGVLLKTALVKQSQLQLQISDLANGIYFVEVISGNWAQKQKLVINR
jgi:ligand-binding sensor domain-containing protein